MLKNTRHAGGLEWVLERLEAEPSFVRKSMFGCHACYLHGRLMLVVANRKKEPWQGILIPTEEEFHEQLTLIHEGLARHGVLGKWLYLPELHERFEEMARGLTERIVADDPRIGVPAGGDKKADAGAHQRSRARRKATRVS